MIVRLRSRDSDFASISAATAAALFADGCLTVIPSTRSPGAAADRVRGEGVVDASPTCAAKAPLVKRCA